VASSQIIFTKWICFPLNCLILLSIICTNMVSNVRLSFNCIVSCIIMWEGSETYFLNWDTWKLWRLERIGGKEIWWATGPIFLRIWYGPIKRGVSFLDFISLPIPMVGVTFKNTWSPSRNSRGCLLLST